MPAVNELELVRQLLDVPGPRAEVTAAGQASLDALAAREARQRRPLRRGPRRAGRGRRPLLPEQSGARVALACGAAIAAIVVTVATLVALRPAGRLSPGPRVTLLPAPGRNDAPAAQAATVQRAILAAVTSASGNILYIRRSSQGTVPAVRMQEWFWPSQPAPGQHVHMLVAQPAGLEIEIAFTAAAGDQYTSDNQGPAITGTELIIDRQARTWSIQHGATILPDLPMATSVTLLRQVIAEHYWTVIGATKLAGQAAIELITTRTGPNGLRERLWVSARSYLPLRQVKQNWNGPGTALQYDFEFLPATPASLARLTPAIPPGYRHVPAS